MSLLVKHLVDKIVHCLKLIKMLLLNLTPKTLVDAQAVVPHPFIADCSVPVLLDDSVLTDDGTACVHSAPGAGPIDYEVGVKNRLEIYSPITPDGRYTDELILQS